MSPATAHASLTIEHTRTGRAVHLQSDGTLYVAHNYTIYTSGDDGKTWSRLTAMPRTTIRRAAEVSRLACRLLRQEVRAFLQLSDGTYVAANREGVYYCRPGDGEMTPSRIDDHGPSIRPPMCMTAGPGNRVIWGEYWGNRDRRPVRLYVSEDCGRSFDVAHVFEAGSIKHVHNLLYDRKLNLYWVLVGDHGDEPGIGRLSADLKNCEWLVKGKQEYRAVCAFDFGDSLIYGTDTEMAPNAVIRLNKESGRIERLAETAGSCIYACRFGGLYALTTTVEPSPVNAARHAALWLSRDGERWLEAFRAPKDHWNARYFQFGSLVLPAGTGPREVILLSGQALQGLDEKTIVARLTDDAMERAG